MSVWRAKRAESYRQEAEKARRRANRMAGKL